ncbi:MAG TPA: PaaI family thioesterase [Jatrophihabitantaceae bacterium]|nr:PaaI family thioesterase [Jatrophihabitantaceae bacterium]
MSEIDYTALMPFAAAAGVRIVRATADEVLGELDWSAERTTAGGALHGGAIMTLADSVGAVCAFLNLPEGATTSTTSSSTVFVRGVRSGTVTALARPLHVGRSTIAVVTEVRDDSGDSPGRAGVAAGRGRLVAQVTQSQAVLYS